MTEKRVNGYPVRSSAGFGKSTRSYSTYDLNSVSRHINQTSQLKSTIKSTVPPKPNVPGSIENTCKPAAQISNTLPGKKQDNQILMAKEMVETNQRRRLSADDNVRLPPVRVRPPIRPRRATEKYVKPKSTFYIPGASNTSKTETTEIVSTRRPRPPQRNRSIHRRSASLGDILNSRDSNGQNLIMFSSDEEDAGNSDTARLAPGDSSNPK